jgi:hypothetical protein
MLERMPERGVRWRSLGVLFLAGGLLALIALALPLSPDAWLPGVALLGVSAAAAGGVMLVFGPRLPERLMSPMLAFGTLLITLAIIANRDSASAFALFYVWVGFDAYYFLGRGQALRHLILMGAAYAIALAAAGGVANDEAARWLLTMGTVVTAGLLAGALNDRAERLIERLADAARTDPLTELLNRRGFEERLNIELSRAQRTGRPVSVTSSSSTTATATAPATRPSRRSPPSRSRPSGWPTTWAASVARSSPSSCPTPTSTARSCWPSASAARPATCSRSPSRSASRRSPSTSRRPTACSTRQTRRSTSPSSSGATAA